jgi:minimal PKS ketosynthase (KS/KS alpha)
MKSVKMRCAVITGVGVVAPSGLGRARYWEALLSGSSLIGPIKRFDASGYPCRVGGQVDDALLEVEIDPRKQRTTSHATRLALVAAEQSLRDARLSLEGTPPEAVGVCVGTALGGWVDGEQQHGILLERGARRVNPFIVSGAGNHGPGVEIAAAIAAQGPQVTFSSGCPSALQAIGHAASLVANGSVDVCLAGGTESPLSPMVVAALARTQELSSSDDPGAASRPFDVQHNGMVLTEGSCFLVLESEEGAARRGAHIYAEVVSSISSCDARGMYGVDAAGAAGGRAIHRLLRAADIGPPELDYICAHANGSPAFDRKETIVLKAALGEFAAQIPVSSVKGVLGHPFGAAGAFQVAASVMAIENSTIPPTHNLTEPAPECDLNHVRSTARAVRIRTALVTSYGYGGINSFLLLRKT